MKRWYFLSILNIFFFLSCSDHEIGKNDNSVIRSEQLENIIKHHIYEINNNPNQCDSSRVFVCISFYRDSDNLKMNISTHSLEPVFQLNSNISYKGSFIFEERHILIYDQDSVGSNFYNLKGLQKESIDSLEDKSCTEELFFNASAYRLEENSLVLLEKRVIPNYKVSR